MTKVGDTKKVQDETPDLEDKSQENHIYMKKGSLFEVDEGTALAHCVGQDLKMSAGIAVKFKRKFVKDQMKQLIDQRKAVGQVLTQEVNGRKIFHLITKRKTTEKPEEGYWEDFKRAIQNLKVECIKNKVNSLAIPKLGCGLDQQSWPQVKKLLNKTFAKTQIKVVVYYIDNQNQARNNSSKAKNVMTAPKVFSVGDSHNYGISEEVKFQAKMAKNTIDTFGVVKPGAGLKAVINDLHNLANELTPEDQLVVIAGTNDVTSCTKANNSEPFTEEVINKIVSFAKTTNVTITSIPKRWDMPQLNRKIHALNNLVAKRIFEAQSKLDQDIQDRIIYFDINTILEKRSYEKDGVHIKQEGKVEIARKIALLIKPQTQP